jgi:hypothetical protein
MQAHRRAAQNRQRVLPCRKGHRAYAGGKQDFFGFVACDTCEPSQAEWMSSCGCIAGFAGFAGWYALHALFALGGGIDSVPPKQTDIIERRWVGVKR